MLRFGGTMTLSGLVLYATFNFDKVLLGRFFGADAIGIYGRASQLIRIPVDNLNSAVGGVAFAALSRLQNDPERVKRYFIKGYSLVVTMTLPITVGCALFSDDLILVLLGPKWKDVAELFRIMAPTILVFAIANPLGWLLSALGFVERELKIALVFAPFMITGYAVGLAYGPRGVAIAYSGIMVLGIVPIIAAAVRGTLISVWDILFALHRPLIASVMAAALAFVVPFFLAQTFSPLPRLVLESTVFGVAYFGALLLAAGRKSFYFGFLTDQYQQR
jgi:PST family polysaccharide transporter